MIITEQQNIGKVKYVISFNDGKRHKDGSLFFDVRIFRNKNKKDEFIKTLTN